MKKMHNSGLNIFIFLFFLGFSGQKAAALSYTDITSTISDVFAQFTDSNEGETTFRSLLIPFGGRTESLGSAYTGLCDDISYLQFNPAAGAIQKETQLALFHNSWIADSKLETLAFTTRLKNHKDLSFGGYASCFYMPFTEYNLFGNRVSGNYYTETMIAINGSYNFLAGYDFKGLTLGVSLKAGWRGIPDYTDNNTDAIIQGSGLAQCGLSLMADVGLMLQFNFLKFYSSRDPNVRIGISAQNLGISLTGFGKEIKIDDPLPTTLAAGISLKFIKPVTLSLDFVQPLNLQKLTNYMLPYISTGVSIQFTPFLSFLSGFSIKGANPRISAGLEFEIAKIRLNFNYSLDITSSISTFNRFSLSAKIMLGDKGRSIVDAEVDRLYQTGLKYYADAEWEKAIEIWQEAVELNKRFDPAIQGIQSAQRQIDMFKSIKESLLLDQN